MIEERPPRRPPRRVSSDDDVVYIPPAPDTERSAPRKLPDAFSKLVQTPAEQMREIVSTQRKMALQLDGFGQAMNRRFDIFHEELAMLRTTVTESHAPRLDKVEATLGQKVAKGGGIVGLLIVALPLLSEVLPKWKGLFDSILGALQ
jgi:hypothetical protein